MKALGLNTVKIPVSPDNFDGALETTIEQVEWWVVGGGW